MFKCKIMRTQLLYLCGIFILANQIRHCFAQDLVVGQVAGHSYVQKRATASCQGDIRGIEYLPNIGRSFHGYNIFYGYPGVGGELEDPGFRNGAIFKVSYDENQCTSDIKYRLPDGIDVQQVASECDYEEMKIEIFANPSSLQGKYSSSVEVSGGIVPPFKASPEYNREVNMSSNSVELSQKETCEQYNTSLKQGSPPRLDTSFVARVKDLMNNASFYKFFDDYGTHFVEKGTFGTLFIFSGWTSEESFEEMQSIYADGKIDFQTIVAYLFGIPAPSIELKLGVEQKNRLEEMKQNIKKNVRTVGGTHTRDLEIWQKEMSKTPALIKISLQDITELFDTKYFKGENATVFNNDALRHLKERVDIHLNDYCGYLKAKRHVSTCDDEALLVSSGGRQAKMIHRNHHITQENSYEWIGQVASDGHSDLFYEGESNTIYRDKRDDPEPAEEFHEAKSQIYDIALDAKNELVFFSTKYAMMVIPYCDGTSMTFMNMSELDDGRSLTSYDVIVTDSSTRTVYWTNFLSHQVYSADYAADGTRTGEARVVLANKLHHPSGLWLTKGRLYIQEYDTGIIHFRIPSQPNTSFARFITNTENITVNASGLVILNGKFIFISNIEKEEGIYELPVTKSGNISAKTRYHEENLGFVPKDFTILRLPDTPVSPECDARSSISSDGNTLSTSRCTLVFAIILLLVHEYIS